MKTVAIRIVKIFAGILIAVLVLHTALLIVSGIGLRNAYRELERAGRPMKAAQIVPPEISADRNAAPLYNSAFALLDSESIGEETLLKRLGAAATEFNADPESAAKREALEGLLSNETFLRGLELIEQASMRPECNFGLAYDQGAAMLFPHVNGLLKVGRILSAQALLDAQRGNAAGAWRAIETCLRMADAVRDEPVLISALVRVAVYRTALIAIRQICEVTPPDDATAQRLEERMIAADDLSPFILALDGERILFGEWVFNLANRHGVSEFVPDRGGRDWQEWLLALSFRYRPARQADKSAYLRFMAKATRDAALPFWESMPPRHTSTASEGIALPWYTAISRIVTPALSQARIGMTMFQAELRVTRTGLALIRHKATHGDYPSTLAEIDPRVLDPVPPDPFTGRPLAYRIDGDGFVLYSLGENLADDGGSSEGEKYRPLDIAWVYSP